MIGWLRDLLREKPRKVVPGSFEWQAMYGYPQKNPVHEYFWPECEIPLPHGHHIATFYNRKGR